MQVFGAMQSDLLKHSHGRQAKPQISRAPSWAQPRALRYPCKRSKPDRGICCWLLGGISRGCCSLPQPLTDFLTFLCWDLSQDSRHTQRWACTCERHRALAAMRP